VQLLQQKCGGIKNSSNLKRQNELLKFSALDLLNLILKTGAKEAFANVVVVLQLILTTAVNVKSCERTFKKLK